MFFSDSRGLSCGIWSASSSECYRTWKMKARTWMWTTFTTARSSSNSSSIWRFYCPQGMGYFLKSSAGISCQKIGTYSRVRDRAENEIAWGKNGTTFWKVIVVKFIFWVFMRIFLAKSLAFFFFNLITSDVFSTRFYTPHTSSHTASSRPSSPRRQAHSSANSSTCSNSTPISKSTKSLASSSLIKKYAYLSSYKIYIRRSGQWQALRPGCEAAEGCIQILQVGSFRID